MYFLFAGDNFYPGGGLLDYVDTFPTIEAAKEHYETQKNPGNWAHIVELKSEKLVGVLRCYWTWDDINRRHLFHWSKYNWLPG